MSPPPTIDIARLFQFFVFLPTSLPTKRQRERKRKVFRSDLFFSFSFLQLGPVHTPSPPERGGGWQKSLNCPLYWDPILAIWDPQ
jgi:hypothetical protein